MKLHSYNKALAESVVWNLLWLTLGSVLMAICIQSVAAPHGFLSGGVMGVALLVGYWTETLTPLVWYSVLCVPVYVLGWFCVGKRFLLYKAYGTLCTTLCSFFVTFTIPIESEVYATVVGGVLHGAACGIMLRTMGSSGGTLSVPFMTFCNVPLHHAVGTSAAIGFPIAVAGTLGFVVGGWGRPELPAMSLGFVNLWALVGIATASFITAPLGAKLSHSLPAAKLKKGFACFLILVALKMIWGLL